METFIDSRTRKFDATGTREEAQRHLRTSDRRAARTPESRSGDRNRSPGWHEAPRPAGEQTYAAVRERGSTVAAQARDVLMQALQEREPDLGDHVRYVADLAVVIGRQLGSDAEALDELHRAAELHDVGKIAIPDSVLNKPGPLDEDEWRIMRQHTIIGERILGSVPSLRSVARIVRSSHEHWNGSGYPDALRGPEIPLGSRIVLVCDAFSAMTTTRSYRAAMSVEDAVKELVRCAGEQFDSSVVDAFCGASACSVGGLG